MAKFTPYRVNSLPSTGIDANGLYFRKETGNTFTAHLRSGTSWVQLGEVDSVDTVNNLTGNVKIDLSFTSGELKVTATGTGTQAATTTITIIDDAVSGLNSTYSSDKINSLIQSSGGGGATSYTQLVDAASVDLPTINTPLANALDLKQDKLTTDLSLYLDENTNELRVNTSETVQTFTWNSGTQEFILVDEPVIVIGVFVNGIRIADWVNDLNIDVQGKKVTILEPLIGGSIINIHYKFITTGIGATTPYMTESQTDQKILDVFNLFSIYKDYDNISQLLSSQNLQEVNKVYQVSDASGDNNLSFDAGETRRHAFYRFKGSSNNSINDYYLVASPFGIGQGAGALQWGSTEW